MGDFGDVDPTTGLGSNRYTGYGQIDPLAASVANGRITPAQWAAYQKKRRRDAIVGTTLTVGSMLGAGPLANAVGIGAGAGTAAGAGTTAGGVASVPGAVGGSAITAASQGAAFGVPTVGTAASVLPSTSLIPAALKTTGANSMTGTSYVAAEGVKAAANLFGAKKGASSADNSAKLQTQAANKAAEMQAQSSANQLEYLQRQAELDRLSKRFSDKQNYGLSKAGMENDFSRYGDTSFNTRASELSQGRTQDKMYGARQNKMNYMRNLLGMPQNELSVYVEPDALQLTRPTLPDYVDDTTPNK